MRSYKKSLEIYNRDQAAVSQCARSTYYPFVADHGCGALVWDIDGNEYIDFSSASSAMNTGICHPKIVEAIKKQADNLLFYTNGYMYEEKSVILAERLAALAPGDFPKKVAFGVSGSDTIDGAIKFARKFTGRPYIVSFKTAYHGTTYGALSASAISLNMVRGIGPLLPGFYHFDYPLCNRCKWKEKPDTCNLCCLKDMEEAFSMYLPPEEVAAVIIEPIAGDIGLCVPPTRYMQALAALCKKHGILLVCDEVQQGLGRTGKWFCIENYGVVPDIITTAKSLASGMPLSAIIMRADIADALADPSHIFTTAANTVCCAAALATLDVIEEEKLLDRAVQIGDKIRARLTEMKKCNPHLGETRGLGLSIAQDIVHEDGTQDRDAAAKICYRCYELGLILTFLSANALRIQPPLVITEEEVMRGLDIIEEAMADYYAGRISDDVLKFAKGWA